MTLTPQIITILMLDGLFLFFGFIAFVLGLKIIFQWNINSTTPSQYALEKQSYLVSVIIKYIFFLKLPLFLFFIFTCDTLSNIITGAMCSIGVINAVDFGAYLTYFKIANLYLFGFWILLNAFDLKNEKLPFTKLKFLLFSLFFFPFLAEILLEIYYFASLNFNKIALCCGTFFSVTNTFLFKVDSGILVGLFYFFGLVMMVGFAMKHKPLFIVANVMFFFFAITSLIVFFGTYIYELPTHHCPFCLIQKEYYGIGYLLYSTLFIGTFYGTCGGILALITKDDGQFFKISVIFNLLYIFIISLYPLFYYIKNGVWL